mmetsp:Transcript_3198/g.6815  ORF Transcript_3198/g.6815 Transcript_3198/m.6815 type:complete len:458 (-) Transcript_3198:56-1429(-)
MSPEPRPTQPHPVASAFFASHDNEILRSTSEGRLHCNDSTILKNQASYSCGSTLAKIRNSIGWRTRYSSTDWHPVSITPVSCRRGRDDDNNGVENSNRDDPTATSDGSRSEKSIHGELHYRRPELFQVRQIFPGQNNKQTNYICSRKCKSRENEAPSLENECKLGTGATVWPGSMVLLKYLEKITHEAADNPPSDVLEEMQQKQFHGILEGKTIADLGSGTGITTIASALLGAKYVVCTDGCDPVVDLARFNVRHAAEKLTKQAKDVTALTAKDVDKERNFNIRGCEILVRRYLWGDGTLLKEIPENRNCTDLEEHEREDQPELTMHFDIILCADCVVPKLYPIEPLVDALDELSGIDTIAYMSYEKRHYEHFDPAREFRRLAESRNFIVEVISEEQFHPMYYANDIELWKITRCRNHFTGLSEARGRTSKNDLKKLMWGCGHTTSSNHTNLLVGKK